MDGVEEIYFESVGNKEISHIMAEEGQLTATEKVFGNPEMLDHIFSFLKLDSLLKARSVCRQFREVSDLSMKRRIRIVPIRKQSKAVCQRYHTYYVPVESIGFIGKAVALKMRKLEKQKNGLFEDGFVAPSLQAIHLIIRDPAGPCEYKLNGICTASPNVRRAPSFMATVLKLDWLPAVTFLILDKCLTLEDWNSVGLHILQRFPSVVTLKLKLLSAQKKCIGSPLCYTDLKMGEQCGLAGGKLEALENFTFECLQMAEINDAGFDLVKLAPNLKNFQVAHSLLSGDLGVRFYVLLAAKVGGISLCLGKQTRSSSLHEDDVLNQTWADEAVRFIDSALRGLHERMLLSVTCITLHGCIAAADWASFGVHILQKFPALENVKVVLDSVSSSRKELWESLLERDTNHRAEQEFTSVKTVDISYTTHKWEISGKGNHSKPLGVCYDVLKLCPNLKVFNCNVFWLLREIPPANFGYQIKANRQETQAVWTLGMDMWIDPKKGKRFKTPVVGDVAEILKLFGPKEVVLKSGLDLACAVDSSAFATVEALTVENWFLVPEPRGLPLKGANMGPAFQNLKKLTWAGSDPQSCSPICQVNINAGFSRGLAFENVRTLDMVHWPNNLLNIAWEHVMKQIHPHIHKIMPNLQVLVVGFISDDDPLIVNQPYSLTNTLKLVKSFENKLKHLVLVSKNCVSNCRVIQAKEYGCFEGLLSVTVILRKAQFLKLYAIIFANICSKILSIRKLGVYSEQGEDEGQPIVPVDPILIAKRDAKLPGKFKVKTGSRSLLQGKAVFEEVEDSYILWEDVKYSKTEPRNPDAEWLARLHRGERDSASGTDSD